MVVIIHRQDGKREEYGGIRGTSLYFGPVPTIILHPLAFTAGPIYIEHADTVENVSTYLDRDERLNTSPTR